MVKHASSATTSSLSSVQANRAKHLLAPGQIITSRETRRRYCIERLLGQGGFGQVFLATHAGRSDICIKASVKIDGWLCEAYFGQLLDGHPRAIQVSDKFPLALPDGRLLYCLALEYASNGDLRKFLNRAPKGWSERKVRREIKEILGVLGKLHRGGMLHRDLTPLNVFVCDGPRLKLGDFGIVRHQSDRRGVPVDALAWMAPTEFRSEGTARKWQARDDVYQVGQLLGMLVKGDAQDPIRTQEVRFLPCSDHLKEIIHRCIGKRGKRYETADELIKALSKPPGSLKVRVLRTLKGVHLVFTGILSRPRQEAVLAARRAGAIVHKMPSPRTTVVVRGRPNPLQAAGPDAGLKLMEVKRLREKGHKIKVINETQFLRLATKR
jgi:serine/threonine-protein kinase